MQMGFNNDVEYKGFTLHIQTEDHGLRSMKITSQVFRSGAIYDSKTVSYEADVADFDDPRARDEHIRRLMKALHRRFYKRIHEGAYDDRLGLAAPPDGVAAAAPAAAPEASADDVAELQAALQAEASGEVDDDFEPAGLDIPQELLEAEGFAVAGEHAALGATYEAHSRGPAMSDDELQVDLNTSTWLGVPPALAGTEQAFADALFDVLGRA